MAGSSSAKTRFALLPGHDEKENHFTASNKIPRRMGRGYTMMACANPDEV
jgi:hypothetical protein